MLKHQLTDQADLFILLLLLLKRVSVANCVTLSMTAVVHEHIHLPRQTTLLNRRSFINVRDSF